MAGLVWVNGQKACKPGARVRDGDLIHVEEVDKYVSRGGLKLEHAIRQYQLSVSGQRVVDLGASTGGFTDCLLQHGASQVYAVDVGRGQLAWKLRQDPRVVVMEKTNARHLKPSAFPQPFDPVPLLVIDCSFISLQKILPSAVELLLPSGRIVALVKPQFEAGKSEVDKGKGVITDPSVHQRVLDDLRAFVDQQTPLLWRGVVSSPLRGPAGNQEFLALLENTSRETA